MKTHFSTTGQTLRLIQTPCLETYSLSISMCFGKEPKPKRRPHNNRRTVKTLEQHGYGIDFNKSVVGIHPINQEEITLHQVADYLGGQNIAMLGVYDDSL